MSGLKIPRNMRDAGFQRRFAALRQAENNEQRREILSEPLVAERIYDPTVPVDCPAGHVELHAAERHNYAGMTFVARSCALCGNGWWERVAL
jgi:hypothetical protein